MASPLDSRLSGPGFLSWLGSLCFVLGQDSHLSWYFCPLSCIKGYCAMLGSILSRGRARFLCSSGEGHLTWCWLANPGFMSVHDNKAQKRTWSISKSGPHARSIKKNYSNYSLVHCMIRGPKCNQDICDPFRVGLVTRENLAMMDSL